jgi:hypothetical protein
MARYPARRALGPRRPASWLHLGQRRAPDPRGLQHLGYPHPVVGAQPDRLARVFEVRHRHRHALRHLPRPTTRRLAPRPYLRLAVRRLNHLYAQRFELAAQKTRLRLSAQDAVQHYQYGYAGRHPPSRSANPRGLCAQSADTQRGRREVVPPLRFGFAGHTFDSICFETFHLTYCRNIGAHLFDSSFFETFHLTSCRNIGHQIIPHPALLISKSLLSGTSFWIERFSDFCGPIYIILCAFGHLVNPQNGRKSGAPMPISIWAKVSRPGLALSPA